MAERIYFSIPDPRKEPFIKLITATGNEVLLRRRNTSRFSYLGSLALFDHVFFYGDGKTDPFYIFKDYTPQERFTELTDRMTYFHYPHNSNQATIEEVDINAYEQQGRGPDKITIEDIVKIWTATEE